MSSVNNMRITKAQYLDWLSYLRNSGFTVTEVNKGGMAEMVEVKVTNPDGETNVTFGATHFLDAETGRRVYFQQIRAAVSQTLMHRHMPMATSGSLAA